MKLTIFNEYLHRYLALGWKCTAVDEGVCTVEHPSMSPPVPCHECGEAISFGRYTRFAGECIECFREEVLH